MHSNISILSLLICLLLAACDPGSQQRLDRETLEREMRRREPRRIKEAEIIDAAMAQGQEISRMLHENAGKQADTLPAGNCCPPLPTAIQDSVRARYQAEISCFPLAATAPNADSLDQQLLEAYRYSQEQQLPLQTNIQAHGPETIVYTTPVTNGSTTTSACAIWRIRLSRKQVVLSIQ